VVEGLLEVADRSAALVQIERLGLFPVAVDARKGEARSPVRHERRAKKVDLKALLPPALRNRAESESGKPKLQETGDIHSANGQPVALGYAPDSGPE